MIVWQQLLYTFQTLCFIDTQGLLTIYLLYCILNIKNHISDYKQLKKCKNKEIEIQCSSQNTTCHLVDFSFVFTNSAGSIRAGSKIEKYWIGLSDTKKEGAYVWDSGHSVSDPYNILAKWRDLEPRLLFSTHFVMVQN